VRSRNYTIHRVSCQRSTSRLLYLKMHSKKANGAVLAQPLRTPGCAMPRLLRFIPDNGSRVEVTTRTTQSRLLLTATPQLNRI
jgi:hypothetical protein